MLTVFRGSGSVRLPRDRRGFRARMVSSQARTLLPTSVEAGKGFVCLPCGVLLCEVLSVCSPGRAVCAARQGQAWCPAARRGASRTRSLRFSPAIGSIRGGSSIQSCDCPGPRSGESERRSGNKKDLGRSHLAGFSFLCLHPLARDTRRASCQHPDL